MPGATRIESWAWFTARSVQPRRHLIYAIIRAGGRQYRVRPEQTLQIDRLATEAGATVEFREVLLIGDNGGTQVGNPFVDGARVIAEVLEQGRDAKILVFKYKNKTRYRRRHGHRQGFTRLAIRQILMPGQEPSPEAAEKPARRARKPAAPRRKPAAAAAVAPEEAAAEAIAAEAPQAETEAKPKRATRGRKAAEAEASAEAEAKPKRASRPRKAAAKASDDAETTEAPKPARRPKTKKTDSGE